MADEGLPNKFALVAHETMPPGLSAIFRSRRQQSERPTIVSHSARTALRAASTPHQKGPDLPIKKITSGSRSPLVPGHYPGFELSAANSREVPIYPTTVLNSIRCKLSLLRELRRRACPVLKCYGAGRFGIATHPKYPTSDLVADSTPIFDPPPGLRFGLPEIVEQAYSRRYGGRVPPSFEICRD